MINDLRYAFRTLRRSPAFALSAILALALGIGANTAVFSVVYAVLLKPLPYAEPDRLVKLSEFNATQGMDDGRVSRGTFIDWRTRTKTLDDVAAYSSGGESLWTIGDRLQVVRVAASSPALTRVLSVQPILGRWFGSEQALPGATPQLVISYGLWQRAFGGAADIIGRRVLLEGRTTREIIGVMPKGFAFPEKADAWTNLALGAPIRGQRRRFLSYHAVGRMIGGATLQDVRREFDGLSAQLAVEQPDSNAGWSARVVPLAGSDTREVRASLLALFAAVGGVLLIGCANVANLLLARATARRRETAVRAALGASTTRLVRQSLTEAALLALLGTIAGVLIGTWLCGILVSLAPADVPRLGAVRIDVVLLLFAAAAGILSAAFVGLVPAVQAVRAAQRGALRPELRAVTPRAALARRVLIGGEAAVVVLLLTGAMLFLRTFVGLRGIDLGFEPERVWSVSTRWPLGRMMPGTPGTRPWPRLQRAVDGLVDAVAGIPGVEAAGVISDVPLTGKPADSNVWRNDAPGANGLTPPSDLRDRWRADLAVVTPGYFTALGIPLLRGRNFTDGDRLTDDQLNAKTVPTNGVAVVNQAFAARYFPGEDPIGRTLVVADDQTFGWSRTIVGVVADVRGHTVAEAAEPAIFIPHAQHPDVFLPSLIVRTSLPPAVVATALRDRIAAYDPQLLVQRIRPMDEVIAGALSRPRFNLLLIGTLAALGLTLAAVGIYGVVSFLVTARTREIGIRMALGARAADVRRLVLREGMAPVVAGVAAGLLAWTVAARAIRTLLYGVAPLDPVSLSAAPALLIAIALLACYLPARRATAVDPLVALREE
jgi:putative ABC transport system permease protein